MNFILDMTVHRILLNTCIQYNFLTNTGRSGIFCLKNPGERGVMLQKISVGGRGGGVKNMPIHRGCMDFLWNNPFQAQDLFRFK